MSNFIKIRGARQHNLKNIDVDIPKNQLVVITGVSGSGKSSLAFDTIYAEGQRRYVESLSAYARQFLGVMDKPEVDSIEGLSPAISIDQKTVSQNPRSTVGTITEIYDYFRLLFAKIGQPHCPQCHRLISRLAVDEIVKKIIEAVTEQVLNDETQPVKLTLLSPVVRQRKGEFKDLLANLQGKGYDQIRLDGQTVTLSPELTLAKTKPHTIEIMIGQYLVGLDDFKDKVAESNFRSLLSSLVEQALNLTGGLVTIAVDEAEHLYSEKFSCSNCNIALPEIEPRVFSFNSPLGACVKCKGVGVIYKIEPDLILNQSLSVNAGGIIPLAWVLTQDTWYGRLLRQVATEEKINLDLPLGKISKAKLNLLLNGTNRLYRVSGTNRFGHLTTISEKFDGVVAELQRRYLGEAEDFESAELAEFARQEECDACAGAKLKPEVLGITIDNSNIAQLSAQPVSQLLFYFQKVLPAKLNEYETSIVKPILSQIETRLSFLQNIGLAYLTISRPAKTLAGGELQRIRLASQIGTGLTGVVYVLDEPSIGLHPKDMTALIATLRRLKDLGNSLIVVEHDRETITAADYVIELGPAAGQQGGSVVFSGSLQQLKQTSKSLTGQFLSGEREIKIESEQITLAKGKLRLTGCQEHNLKSITVELPLGNLIAVTGVSGSGKSTLIVETLYPAVKAALGGAVHEQMGKYSKLFGSHFLERVYLVDQSPIGRTPRSNPATYIGFFNEIRSLFSQAVEAKLRGFGKSRFSFNLKGGRCEKCQGAGVLKIEMLFLADVYVICDVCHGKRYNHETLEVHYKGKTIYDILRLTVDEAAEFFRAHSAVYHKLKLLQEVGLGYIELGQSAPTFSGGEAQRIKLVNELSRRQSGRALYILDEPTTGLHLHDIDKLLQTLYRLVRLGNTVIIIEHNLDVIKNCQWLIDLGPDGGEKGGYVIYQGELKGIIREKHSYTGQYLKRCV